MSYGTGKLGAKAGFFYSKPEQYFLSHHFEQHTHYLNGNRLLRDHYTLYHPHQEYVCYQLQEIFQKGYPCSFEEIGCQE